MDRDIYRIHNSTGHWIARVFVAMRCEFSTILKDYGVSICEWAVLASLYQEEIQSPSRIAEFAGVDLAAVTRILDKLTDGTEYVTRSPSQKDRKSFIFELTTKGMILTSKLLEKEKSINDRFLAGISKKERSELLRILKLVLTNSTRGQDKENTRGKLTTSPKITKIFLKDISAHNLGNTSNFSASDPNTIKDRWDFEKLFQDIMECGIKTPIKLIRMKNKSKEKYEVVDGVQRLRIVEQLGDETIPAIIVED